MLSIEPITLEGDRIRLIPLQPSHHLPLCKVGLDADLWRYTTIRLQTMEDMRDYIQTALQAQADGTALPFVIVENHTGAFIGTTRFHSIQPAHLRTEIGFTWIGSLWQRTGFNTEAKYLMLRHAFEQWQCIRVEFKADRDNLPSCRALLHIGATQEAILRSYMISAHRGVRDVALFSILAEEWPQVKITLESKMKRV